MSKRPNFFLTLGLFFLVKLIVMPVYSTTCISALSTSSYIVVLELGTSLFQSYCVSPRSTPWWTWFNCSSVACRTLKKTRSGRPALRRSDDMHAYGIVFPAVWLYTSTSFFWISSQTNTNLTTFYHLMTTDWVWVFQNRAVWVYTRTVHNVVWS